MFDTTVDQTLRDFINKNRDDWYEKLRAHPTLSFILSKIESEFCNVIYHESGFFSARSKDIPGEQGLFCVLNLLKKVCLKKI